MKKRNKNKSRRVKNRKKHPTTPVPVPSTPNDPNEPKVKKPKLPRLHNFSKGDIVDVFFPKKNPFYLGRARVTEIGRKAKGKDYDIEVIFEHSKEVKAVHPHHLKNVEDPDDYPETLDKGKVHVKPKYRTYAGVTGSVPPPIEESIRDFLDTLPESEEEEREAKKKIGCIRCHNGDLYYAGGRSSWRSEEAEHFAMPSYAEYIILIPAKFNAGRVSFRRRKKVEFCRRCQPGKIITFSTKHDGSGEINHKALLRMGYIGMVVVPKR